MDEQFQEEGPEGRPAKRQRASRACDFCRSKKIKCDGAEGSCNNCEVYGVTCDYTERIKKRGVPAGKYQLLLQHQALAEATLGALLSKFSGLEDIINDILKLDEDVRSKEIDRLQEIWRGSQGFASFSALLARSNSGSANYPIFIADPTLPPEAAPGATTTHTAASRYKDPLSNGQGCSTSSEAPILQLPGLVPSNRRQDNLTLSDHRSNLSLDLPELNEMSLNGQEHDSVGVQDHTIFSGTSKRELPLPTADLLEKYFVNIHSIVPVLDKIESLHFFHSHNFDKSENKYPTSQDKLSVISLSCALASSSAFEPSTTEPRTESIWQSPVSRTDVAGVLIQVQEIILSSMISIRAGAWIKARRIITVLCDLVIHYRIFEASTNHRQCLELIHKAQRRAWSACFLIDTLVAAKLRILPVLRSQNCDVPFIDEDVSEEWDSWTFNITSTIRKSPARIASTYNHFLGLAHILNEYISQVVSYRSSKERRAHLASAITSYQSARDHLRAWSEGLPSHLKVEMIWTDSDVRLKSSSLTASTYAMNLNIAYHSFTCFICTNLQSSLASIHISQAQGSVLENALHHFSVSSSCAGQLCDLFLSKYGEDVMHPFLDLFRHLMRPLQYLQTNVVQGRPQDDGRTPSSALDASRDQWHQVTSNERTNQPISGTTNSSYPISPGDANADHRIRFTPSNIPTQPHDAGLYNTSGLRSNLNVEQLNTTIEIPSPELFDYFR